MTTTPWTRVTVEAPGRKQQVDLDLPANAHVIALLPQLCSQFGLLGTDANPRLWTLAHAHGRQELALNRSLADAQVEDGAKLWLVEARGETDAVVTEDVLDEARGILDQHAANWSGQARTRGGWTVAAAAVAAFTVPALAAAAGGLPWLVTLLLAGVGAVAGMLASVLGGNAHVAVLAAAVPSWALIGYAVASGVGLPGAGQWLLSVALAGAGLVMFSLGERFTTVVAAGIALASFGAVGTVLVAVGAPPGGAAAVLIVLTLFAIGWAPQVALQRSSVVPLMRAQESGQTPSHDTVVSSVDRGQATVTGVVCGVAASAVAAAAVAATAGSVWGGVLAVLTAAAFAVRSRAFSRAAQVLPMLMAGVGAGVVAAFGLGSWLPAAVTPWAAVGLLVVVLIAALIGARVRLPEVSSARARRFLNALDTIVVLAVPPVALMASGLIGWVQSLMS